MHCFANALFCRRGTLCLQVAFDELLFLRAAFDLIFNRGVPTVYQIRVAVHTIREVMNPVVPAVWQ